MLRTACLRPALLGLLLSGCTEGDAGNEAGSQTTGAGAVATGDTKGAPTYSTAAAGSATSSPMTANGADDSGAESSTTDATPVGPSCSVQQVTEGALLDPLEVGEVAGLFPTVVGAALEDYCGCHTLNNGGQNLKYEFLRAPGGSLFTSYDDLARGYAGGTLGDAMSFQVIGNQAMPPGSCYFPDEPSAVLAKWFEDGAPDGATFVYP